MRSSNRKIYLIPLGLVAQNLVQRLSSFLSERFLLSFKVFPNLKIDLPGGGAPSSYRLFDTMKKQFPTGGGYLLGITDFDLSNPKSDSIFGEAIPHRGAAMVSLYRLRPEFYHQAPDEEKLFQRLVTESAHQIGHLLGFPHCPYHYCAMYPIKSIEDLDKQGNVVCSECEEFQRKSQRNY